MSVIVCVMRPLNVTMGSQGGSSSAGGSMFGLTLDEVQTQLGKLGKPLGGMNLDELLRSVGEGEADARPLPGDKERREIQSENCGSGVGDGDGGDDGDGAEGGASVQERKPTFGEVTLEDFLVNAGVVAEMESLHGDKGGGESEVGVGSVLADTGVHGRNVVMGRDRTVQRRQKRMIKNRESAARSRARKQAYTHELEHKVLQLEEENARLRRQMAIHTLDVG
ncbi:hypothetical protein MLD38_028845 [Melastoma candidum]|uniref:Uncharacterized protein n=1 Tax=Melastoma candidum TaxID=119954 RepID=A0ACB9N3T6_9MYRT|nr:hypothetical protein MLD38_028845 [Melastoma candidum]